MKATRVCGKYSGDTLQEGKLQFGEAQNRCQDSLTQSEVIPKLLLRLHPAYIFTPMVFFFSAGKVHLKQATP